MATIVSSTAATASRYTVQADPSIPGTATIDITDNGSTAVIHATGPTVDGVANVDVVINCPSIVRV